MVEIIQRTHGEAHRLVAIHETDGVVGHLSYQVPSPGRAVVVGLVVDRTHRREGIGTRLIEHLWAVAPEAVWADWTPTGKELFKSFQESNPDARVDPRRTKRQRMKKKVNR